MFLSTTLSAIAGAATWSLAEYTIHNLLGHKFVKNKSFFTKEHTRHHATTSYFATTASKARAATLTTAAMAPLAMRLVGKRLGLIYTASFVGAYVGYELLHRRAHTHAPKTRYGRWMRKHHFHHHFHSPFKNHGVTSPIWDHLFGSHETPAVIRVPERHAMPWLVDPATGEVWPEHAADYCLQRKKKKAKSNQHVGAQPNQAA